MILKDNQYIRIYLIVPVEPSWNSTVEFEPSVERSSWVVVFTLNCNISLSLSSSAIIGVSEFDISVVSSLSRFSFVSINSLFLLVILLPTMLYLFKKLDSDSTDLTVGSGWLFKI